MKSSQISTILQMIAMILLASSAAGEKRLARWQAAIRAYRDFHITLLSGKGA